MGIAIGERSEQTMGGSTYPTMDPGATGPVFNDLDGLAAPGVYFLRGGGERSKEGGAVISKVVVAR